MLKLSVNTFTNPNGERVCQAFVGGFCLTREFPAGSDAVTDAARKAFDSHYGKAMLYTWSLEDGETLIASKEA